MNTWRVAANEGVLPLPRPPGNKFLHQRACRSNQPYFWSMTDLTILQWMIAFLAALFVGLNKSGIAGIDVIVVTVLVFLFGAKTSTGVLMPLLMVGDAMAVWYYHRHAQWNFLFKLLPWMIVGVLAGVYLGKDLPEHDFRQWMSAMILVTTAFMFWMNMRKNTAVPNNRGFAGFMGFAAGFTTMVGNLAGPFSNIYFLAMRLPKDQFIGTASWLFCLVNLFKLPFHIWVWHTITVESALLDLKLLPAIVLGFAIGVKVINKTPDKLFRQLVLALTAVGAIILLFR